MNDDKKVSFSARSTGQAPTPEQLAEKALAGQWFEWLDQRSRAEAAVAAIIREDRARIGSVVERARVLLPGLLRDLTIAVGGRS